MKNKIKLNIDLVKCFSIILFLALTWIVSICVFDGTYKLNPIFIVAMVLIFFSILCCIYKSLIKKFKNLSDKSTWIFYSVLTIIMIIIQLIIGYMVRTDPSWDLKLCIQSAQEILQYRSFTRYGCVLYSSS